MIGVTESFRLTELGPLPDEWGVVRLGDKGRFQYGYTTSATEKDTGTKFLRITDIKEDGAVNWDTVPYGIIDDENLQKFRLSEGNVLFARIGATTGKTCIIEGAIPNAVFASYLIRFVPNEELYPKYVFYFTQTREYQELVNAGKEGKLKKGLSANELKNFKSPSPPLPEQHRIAAVLSAAQDAKGTTEAVIGAAKSLKKSLMRHLFTYGPVPAGAVEGVPLVETEIGLVPEGWGIFQTKDVCSLIIDCPHSTPKFTETGILVVRTSNVRDGNLVLNSPSFTSDEEYKERIKRGTPEEGDILFTREAPIGEACLIPSDLKLCLGQRMMLLRPDKFLLNGYFLVQAFYSKQVREKMLVQGKGVTAKHLNVADVKRLLFPRPPLPTQQKIAHILSTVDKKIEAEENKKKAIDELFKSLLHNLMTGKVRVNHLEVTL
jgi:type I restriction enzyme S subunit